MVSIILEDNWVFTKIAGFGVIGVDHASTLKLSTHPERCKPILTYGWPKEIGENQRSTCSFLPS
jgi:hypothetical protein